MPSPTLFEWCNSIHRTVHDLINNYTKTDAEASPTLSAIQSLRGKSSGEKRKDLNLLIRRIIDNIEQHGELVATEFNDVPQIMGDYVKTCIAVRLRSDDGVIEALRSKDRRIVKKAMSADWFFDGASGNVDVGNFVSSIVPLVSLRTRLDVFKKLGKSLHGHEKKAEEFFEAFVELYGLEVSLPILSNCSETFIYAAVLKHKIVLPVKLLRVLYERHPNLVVRYLHLGNKNNVDNVEDRKVHEILIHDYDTFLPTLIKNHPSDFVELYRLTPEKLLKLSGTTSAIFLRNSSDEIVNDPHVFLKLLSFDVVKKNLSKEKFEAMFENLLPADRQDFNVDEVLAYVKHYPEGERLALLKDTFKKVYKTNVLEDESCLKSRELLRILTIFERERVIETLISKCEKKSSLSNEYLSYLPPSRTLSTFKVKIENATVAEERALLFGHMLTSCGVHKSDDEGLLQVLRYYHDVHRNEQNPVLCSFLQDLKREFDLDKLSVRHWAMLKKILDHAYLRNELFKSRYSLIESVLEAALRHGTINRLSNVDSTLEMLLELKVEQTARDFNALRDRPELQRVCLERFFQLIPTKYPEGHAFWRDKCNRISLALSVARTIERFNEDVEKLEDVAGLDLKDYPWIQKLSLEFFPRSEVSNRKTTLMKIVKKISPEFYESTMDELSIVRDIETGQALSLLQRNPRKILANWQDYLNESRDLLHQGKTKRSKRTARRFVAATKWHHEIPVKFVDRCIEELKQPGSILILGILLEGESFEKIVTPFLPTEATIDHSRKDAKEQYDMMREIVLAMRYANPPVSLASLAPFCQGDYATLTEGTLVSVASRLPLDEVMEFANRTLVDRPGVVTKQRIRLISKVTTSQRLWRRFLLDTWKSGNVSVRYTTARMMFELFTKKANEDSYEMMKSCVAGLTSGDRDSVVELSDIEGIDKRYLSDYAATYLHRIEELFEADLDFSLRAKCVCLIIESINAKLMRWITDEVSSIILERYFFDADSLDVSRAARNFAVRTYLLSAKTGEEFEKRLSAVMAVLRKVMDKFDEPHAKERRFYAANFTVHEFFRDLLIELSCSAAEDDRKLQIVESMLKVFTSTLSPWQESSSYVAFNLYREYLLAESAENFGTRCAKRVPGLIEDVGTESIVDYVAETLNEFVRNKIFRDSKYPKLKLSVVKGLIDGDGHYGAWIGAELLDSNEVKVYDERYEGIVEVLKRCESKAVRNSLYCHLNRIQMFRDGEESDE